MPGYGEEAGAALAAHPGIDHLAFTGSRAVGQIVSKAAADNVIPVTLELGGRIRRTSSSPTPTLRAPRP